MIVTRREIVVFGKGEGRPQFYFRQVIEERHASRHYARNRVTLTCQSNLATQNARAPAEAPLPQFIAEQHDAMSTKLPFLRRKETADRGRDLQHLKKIRCNICALNSLGRFAGCRKIEIAVVETS